MRDRRIGVSESLQRLTRIARHLGVIDDSVDPVEMTLTFGESKEIARQQQVKDLATSAGQHNVASCSARFDAIPVIVGTVGPVYLPASIAIDRDGEVFHAVWLALPEITHPLCLARANLPHHRDPPAMVAGFGNAAKFGMIACRPRGWMI